MAGVRISIYILLQEGVDFRVWWVWYSRER